jgi:hypothetical protein
MAQTPYDGSAPASRRWWTSPWMIVVSVAVIVAVIAAIALYSRLGHGPSPAPASGSPARVINLVTHVPGSSYDQVPVMAGGGDSSSFESTGTQASSGTQPYLLYIGAEFCPFCAAERWSIITALSRFGTFSGLSLITSSSTDVYPNTPTFTFLNATFQSRYISFTSREVEDRNEQPLQTLTSGQALLESRYNSAGYIPFILIDDRYYQVSSAYSPGLLAGQNWEKIASALSQPREATTKAILGEANIISAGICNSDAGRPASVCRSSGVEAATGALPSNR